MEEKKKRTKATYEAVRELTEESSRAHSSLVAKKDFEIHHNGYQRKIKAGDDLSDVPEKYLANLRTEGVL